ncbi:1,4-alpha-glucan branching protein GlgB [Pontivivens insulae]|uniref:1,4-alpha-glucan branching enzyme GlgB n=1 Tax=Pontivivens insulae TaxID=1639689 RepID=A0A2R8AD31_9RHOB|nr:1,4-alpha-glucan branching protein GlgB [Pontivivens insulae]RED14079.1 1,4-alpha-glucan branching enzyme [Pontivivens insulae]SPF30153.1 1,4-alpha-glucan branching enzyme GlgB [Pontivivens insulae]
MAKRPLTEPGAIAAILSGTHSDPFGLLGLHQTSSGYIARAFVPGAQSVEIETLEGKALGALTCRDPQGFFDGEIAASKRQPVRLRASNADAKWSVMDPYSFSPVLGDMDDYLYNEGSHSRLFDRMGAQVITHEGVEGTNFAVWAPNARRVSVVGPFNNWDGRRHAMRLRMSTGVWEIFVPGVTAGEAYKFELIDANGGLLPLKADPFAFAAEMRPDTASIVHKHGNHDWQDKGHVDHWKGADKRRTPVSIYEVHPGSWQRDDDGGFLSWDAMADRLIPYCVKMGFTHIEFLPISEHPYDPSWGYQTTGLYAPSARFGEPDGFARFMEGAHGAGLGVILDWVPAHFPTDAHGLGKFDGTALYEHADPRQGYHPDWNTLIYNFGRREVENYLVNNALFWAEKYHVDGLRVDAVASMLYLDYSREEGQWVPNDEGGNVNKEAVAFLMRMNEAVYGAHPNIMTIAEESTAFPGVSQPTDAGGLGFGFKWNMGWMHDTLEYMSKDPIYRKHHHGEMMFTFHYAMSENFVLPLSHDEVVHGKGSLLAKMPGDTWQKHANLRAYYGFMWGYPGKKLLFMGQEFAQEEEWSESRGLDWHLLDDPLKRGMKDLVRDLNAAYKQLPALHGRDNEGDGVEVVVGDDADNSVFAWLRHAPGGNPVLVVSNMTPAVREGYRVPLPERLSGRWAEVLNTDATVYGGSGVGNMGGVEASDGSITLTLPPLSTMFFVFEG